MLNASVKTSWTFSGNYGTNKRLTRTFSAWFTFKSVCSSAEIHHLFRVTSTPFSCSSRAFCSTLSTRRPLLTCQSSRLSSSRPWTTLQSASWSCDWRAAEWKGVCTSTRGTDGAGGRCGWTWCRHLLIAMPSLSLAGLAPGYEQLRRHLLRGVGLLTRQAGAKLKVCECDSEWRCMSQIPLKHIKLNWSILIIL